MSSTEPPADLRIAQTQRAAERSRAEGPWSTAHLRWCLPTLLAAGALLIVLAAVFAGGRAVAGAALGIGIVAAFFLTSTVIVARVGRTNPKAVMVTALVVYAIKVLLLGIVLVLMPRDGVFDTRWMAGAVAVGVIAWMAAHLRYVWTAKIFYVDPS